MPGECRCRPLWRWLALAGLAVFLFVALRIRSELVMAISKSKPAEEPAEGPAVERDVDRVAMVSLRADGTPDQSDGFEATSSSPGPSATAPEQTAWPAWRYTVLITSSTG